MNRTIKKLYEFQEELVASGMSGVFHITMDDEDYRRLIWDCGSWAEVGLDHVTFAGPRGSIYVGKPALSSGHEAPTLGPEPVTPIVAEKFCAECYKGNKHKRCSAV